jgi:hypothetical protein
MEGFEKKVGSGSVIALESDAVCSGCGCGIGYYEDFYSPDYDGVEPAELKEIYCMKCFVKRMIYGSSPP